MIGDDESSGPDEQTGPAPDRFLVLVAAIAGASGVIIGAFGAHGLPEYLAGRGIEPETLARRVAQFDTGARYHLVHAVAILAAAAVRVAGPRVVRWAGILFAAGIILFSGSLYVLVLTNTPWLGAITPIGGVAWIIAWAMIGLTGTALPRSRN